MSILRPVRIPLMHAPDLPSWQSNSLADLAARIWAEHEAAEAAREAEQKAAQKEPDPGAPG